MAATTIRSVLALLLLCATAVAQSPGAVAKRVADAFRAGDLETIDTLAQRYTPDPWIIALQLCSSGERESATAFARASKLPEVEALPAYLASRTSDGDAALEGITNAIAELRARRPAEALAIMEKADVGGDACVAVMLLHYRALAHQMARKLDTAEPLFVRGAEEAEKIGWLQMASRNWFGAGNCRNQSFDYRGAIAHWRRKLEVAKRRELGGDVSASWSLIGMMHGQLRELSTALECQEQALKAAGEKWPRQAMGAAARLGIVAVELRDFGKAMQVLEGALPEVRRQKSRALEATILSVLGTVRYHLGDIQGALELHQRGHEMFRELGLKNQAAVDLLRIGMDHEFLGGYAEALSHYDRAAALFRKLGNTQGVADVMGSMARVHKLLGDWNTARAYAEQAVAIAPPSTRHHKQVELATVLRLLERHDEAEKLLEAARGRFTRPEDRDSLARTLIELGQIRQTQGRHETAIEAFREAGSVYASIEMTLGVVSARISAGLLLLERRAIDEALAEFRGCLDVATPAQRARCWSGIAAGEFLRNRDAEVVPAARAALEERARVFAGLSDELGAMAYVASQPAASVGLGAAVRLEDPGLALEFIERGRANALLESLRAGAVLRAARLPADLVEADTAARAKEASALRAFRRASRSEDPARRERARGELDASREARAVIAARIQREAKRAAGLLAPSHASLATVRSDLQPGECLIAYAPARKGATVDDESMAALVVTRRGARLVVLADFDVIEKAARDLRLDSVAFDSGSALEHLRDLVVEPLAIDRKTTRLLVSPYGALAYVPFGLLFHDHEVVHLPSATAHGVLARERTTQGTGVLALGDPQYDAGRMPEVTAMLQRGGEWLRPLPNSGAEAEAVGTEVLLGDEATEAAIRMHGARKRWRAIHVACHGLIDSERPMLSCLALTPSGADDGFLTVHDVFRLTLSTDLVVLAACRTGRGKVVRGEGVLGLTRAFMVAGAPRVIVSLWKVDDEATKALMVKFYELWKPGKISTAAALKRAQGFVRSQERWRHPYYWAAWQLWGLGD